MPSSEQTALTGDTDLWSPRAAQPSLLASWALRLHSSDTTFCSVGSTGRGRAGRVARQQRGYRDGRCRRGAHLACPACGNPACAFPAHPPSGVLAHRLLLLYRPSAGLCLCLCLCLCCVRARGHSLLDCACSRSCHGCATETGASPARWLQAPPFQRGLAATPSSAHSIRVAAASILGAPVKVISLECEGTDQWDSVPSCPVLLYIHFSV